jgi:hypothetical protein
VVYKNLVHTFSFSNLRVVRSVRSHAFALRANDAANKVFDGHRAETFLDLDSSLGPLHLYLCNVRFHLAFFGNIGISSSNINPLSPLVSVLVYVLVAAAPWDRRIFIFGWFRRPLRQNIERLSNIDSTSSKMARRTGRHSSVFVLAADSMRKMSPLEYPVDFVCLDF